MNRKCKTNLALILAFALLLAQCSGGGTDEPLPSEPAISSLSATAAIPTSLLVITGSGFDAKAKLSVSFFDGSGFKLNVPAVAAGATSIKVAVPPYIIPATGLFGPGTVNVQVVQDAGGAIKTSNTVPNFQIQELPTPVAPSGAVTLHVLYGIIAYDQQLQKSVKGTLVESPGLNAALSKNIATLQSLAAQIQAIYKKPSKTFSLGSVKGTEIVIGEKELRATDRILLGMFKSLGSGGSAASVAAIDPVARGMLSHPAAAACQQEADAETSFLLGPNVGTRYANTSSYQGYVGCKSSDISDAIKNANLVIAGTATVAIAVLGLAGAPAMALALPSAALFYVSGMSIVTQLDVAAALKNSNDAVAYKAFHQAVDETVALIRDIMVSKALPETAGQIYDIFMGSSSLGEAFLNTSSVTPPVRTSYSGPFSGSGVEGDACASWRDDIAATITIAVSGNGTLIDPYSGTMKTEGSIVSTLINCCDECEPGGTYPFAGTGAVSGTKGKVEAIASGDIGAAQFIVIFTGGTLSGNNLTGYLTFSLSFEGKTEYSIEKTITLTK